MGKAASRLYPSTGIRNKYNVNRAVLLVIVQEVEMQGVLRFFSSAIVPQKTAMLSSESDGGEEFKEGVDADAIVGVGEGVVERHHNLLIIVFQ